MYPRLRTPGLGEGTLPTYGRFMSPLTNETERWSVICLKKSKNSVHNIPRSIFSNFLVLFLTLSYLSVSHHLSLSFLCVRLHNPKHHLHSLCNLDLGGRFTYARKEDPIPAILPADPCMIRLTTCPFCSLLPTARVSSSPGPNNGLLNHLHVLISSFL